MHKESKANKGIAAIINKLKTISTENGYNFNPTVRQGFLQQISARSQDAFSLPLIAVAPDITTPTGGGVTDNTVLTDQVKLEITAAVDSSGDEVVFDLFNLMRDIRRSLVFDTNNEKLGISELAFAECPFDVPEAGDKYAFLVQKISFKVTDQYA